jgi:protein-tyrosine phosphatase
VVNCTHGESKIPDYHAGKLLYYTFPISHWQLYVNSTNASVQAFTDPMFEFINEAISSGQNVLLHCLAGAHRAGTTGVACIIHFAGLNVEESVAIAKRCRPIIDPIGQLPEFLYRLKRSEDSRQASSAPSSIKTIKEKEAK